MSTTPFRASMVASVAAAILLVQTASAQAVSTPGAGAGAGASAGATASMDLTREQALFDSGSINPFARENLGSFSTAVLKNGIPVVIKRSTSNRILSLKTVITGHVSFTPLEKAGLESVMLTMLTRGSARYTYSDVQRITFETSSSIVPRYGDYDVSSLDLVTIDTYFNRLFPVYSDAILHPAWNAEEFPRVMSDFKLQKQQAASDPSSAAVLDLDQRFFAGHPYAASPDGVGSSLDHISLDDLRTYYPQAVNAGRMFIVAVGNFDPAALVPMLDSTFGTLPRASITRPPVPSFKGTVKPDLQVVPFPRSNGLAYVRGEFAMPDPESPDYAASLVAFDILNDILFEIVRTRNGAAYGAEANVEGGTASYGDISIYRTTVPGKVKGLVDQSIGVLAAGKSLSGNVNVSAAGKGGLGSAAEAASSAFVPVADALPFYKLKFITQFYSGQETNRQIASQIAGSVFYHGDYRHYLLLIDRINAVTADDVVRVARTWLVGNPTLWIALGDPVLLKDVHKEDFLGTLGQ